MGGWYRADRGCPCCEGSGQILTRAEDLGYVRRPDWDDEERAAWLTPSGLKCMVPKGPEFVLSTLCNCARRRHGLPLIDVAA